jgi:hypothetical protein
MLKKLGSKFVSYSVLLTITIVTIYFAFAAEHPLGARGVTEGWDSSVNYSQYEPASHGAYAGNITELNISGISQTKHWQGYWGEVTGDIVLDDANNYTLYEWTDLEPEGEVYAAINSTIDWETIACFNLSGFEASGASDNNTLYWENYFNMTYDDGDGIDETFDTSNHITFAVGDITIPASTCRNIFTYVDDAAQSDKFLEVLLQDQYGEIVFATIIEDDDQGNNTDVIGYDGNTHDFQIIVAEDGTSWSGGSRNTDTTPYYFYVDLE